jgi:hypothetical protein
MTEPPPRKRFQIHLSTAIVMMFVAGGMMWANCSPRTRVWIDSLGTLNVIRRKILGWPLECATVIEELGVQAHYEENLRIVFPELPNESKTYSLEIERTEALVNAAIAMTLLATVYWICEWVIRRRAVRKGA